MDIIILIPLLIIVIFLLCVIIHNQKQYEKDLKADKDYWYSEYKKMRELLFKEIDL